MTLTLRVQAETYAALRRHLRSAEPSETGTFVVLGRTPSSESGPDLILRELVLPRASDWRYQEEDCLTPTTSYINRAAVRAEHLRAGLGFVHSHPSPFHPAALSPVDESSSGLMFRNLAQILGDAPLASIVFTPSTFAGLGLQGIGYSVSNVDHIRIIGDRLETLHSAGSMPHPEAKPIDRQRNERQILAIGEQGVARLSGFRVGIVGVGGTGSCVAEQLVRIGVSNLTLIDDDKMSLSNTTRVYGSRAADAKRKRSKVDVVGKHLERIRPGVIVDRRAISVTEPDLLPALSGLDFVFGCTDTDSSRAILNDLAYKFFVPVLDLGCRIDATGGELRGEYGRARYLRPGLPCLWCTGTIDGRKIVQETLSPDERARLQASGYGSFLGPQPSVIHLTTLVASLGVHEFLTIAARSGPPHDGGWYSVSLHDPFLQRVTSKVDADCRCLRMTGAGEDGAIVA